MAVRKKGEYWRDSIPIIDTEQHKNVYGLGYWDAMYSKRTEPDKKRRVVSLEQQAEYNEGFEAYLQMWREKQLTKLLIGDNNV